jgi:hypothetical protein
VILTFPYTYDGHDVHITVDYTPAVPANFNGRPDTWRDGEAAECELMEVRYIDGMDCCESDRDPEGDTTRHLTDNPDELHRLALAAYLNTIT